MKKLAFGFLAPIFLSLGACYPTGGYYASSYSYTVPAYGWNSSYYSDYYDYYGEEPYRYRHARAYYSRPYYSRPYYSRPYYSRPHYGGSYYSRPSSDNKYHQWRGHNAGTESMPVKARSFPNGSYQRGGFNHPQRLSPHYPSGSSGGNFKLHSE